VSARHGKPEGGSLRLQLAVSRALIRTVPVQGDAGEVEAANEIDDLRHAGQFATRVTSMGSYLGVNSGPSPSMVAKTAAKLNTK
jgi:hypothetical protein